MQVQSVVQKLPIVCLSHTLKVKGSSHVCKESKSPTRAAVGERKWTEVSVGEECVVQVEIRRRCLKGKVSGYPGVVYAFNMFVCFGYGR